VKAPGVRARLVAAVALPTMGRADDALGETVRCRTLSKAVQHDITVLPEDVDWLDLCDAGDPMTEQLNEALDEAVRSMVTSSAERSFLCEGHLDDVVQLSNNKGPWVAN
jgi:hypothetical protein